MAAAKSERMFAHRLGDIFARAGTIVSRVWRMSSRFKTTAAGGWSRSRAKLVTAERRSRLRLVVSPGWVARRSTTVCSVTGVVVCGSGSIFMAWSPLLKWSCAARWRPKGTPTDGG